MQGDLHLLCKKVTEDAEISEIQKKQKSIKKEARRKDCSSQKYLLDEKTGLL